MKFCSQVLEELREPLISTFPALVTNTKQMGRSKYKPNEYDRRLAKHFDRSRLERELNDFYRFTSTSHQSDPLHQILRDESSHPSERGLKDCLWTGTHEDGEVSGNEVEFRVITNIPQQQEEKLKPTSEPHLRKHQHFNKVNIQITNEDPLPSLAESSASGQDENVHPRDHIKTLPKKISSARLNELSQATSMSFSDSITSGISFLSHGTSQCSSIFDLKQKKRFIEQKFERRYPRKYPDVVEIRQ